MAVLARAVLALAVLVLALLCQVGCASRSPPPDWQLASSAAARRFEVAWLQGHERLAAVELARARSELAQTGRPDLRARLELLACALQVAALGLDDCPGYRVLAQDAGTADEDYAAYLVGQASSRDAVQALAGEDPLSRLVAAGVLFHQGRLDPAGLDRAVDTASAQGWRRPLLVWLSAQRALALRRGEAKLAARIQRRIELVLENPGAQ
jgi:hypothetical protein